MYYIIHIATAFQSISNHRREIQELIWTKTQRHFRLKHPNHPILSATLDQYLGKKAPDIAVINSALKTKMALTPEFGHVIAIARAIVANGGTLKAKVDLAERPFDLLAELADYNPSRYISLRSRMALWGLTLNGNGKESGFEDPETLIEQWRRGNSAPLEENLKLTLLAIHQILNKTSPFLFRSGQNGERHLSPA